MFDVRGAFTPVIAYRGEGFLIVTKSCSLTSAIPPRRERKGKISTT
jgi:hypothetical protein